MKIPNPVQRDIDRRIAECEVRIKKGKELVRDKTEKLGQAKEELAVWENELKEINNFIKSVKTL